MGNTILSFRKKFLILLVNISLLTFACASDDVAKLKEEFDQDTLHVQKQKKGEKEESKMKLNTHLDSVSYSLGLNIGTNIVQKGIQKINLVAFATGINDVVTDKKPVLSGYNTNMIIDSYLRRVYKQLVSKNIKEGAEFLATNKKKGVKTLKSGLQIKILKKGKGKPVGKYKEILLHYESFYISGVKFDSSIKKQKPLRLKISKDPVIKAWSEVIPLMRKGSKWRIYVPPYLAYGMQGLKNVVQPYQTLIFELQII